MDSLFWGIGLLFSMYAHLFAQSDSVKYFNDYWQETSQDSASYYRLVDKTATGFHVRDFYRSGILQMEGDFSSLEPEIQEGYFIWYFENGRKYAEGNYVHGQRDGIWILWYPDGLKKQELKFLQNGESVSKWRSKREKNTIELIEKGVRKRTNGKGEEAERLFNTAIAINPYSAEAFYERGLLKCYMKRIEEGCRDFRKAKTFGFIDTKAINDAIAEYCK